MKIYSDCCGAPLKPHGDMAHEGGPQWICSECGKDDSMEMECEYIDAEYISNESIFIEDTDIQIEIAKLLSENDRTIDELTKDEYREIMECMVDVELEKDNSRPVADYIHVDYYNFVNFSDSNTLPRANLYTNQSESKKVNINFTIDALELKRILFLFFTSGVGHNDYSSMRVLIRTNEDGTCSFLCNNPGKELYLNVDTDKVEVFHSGKVSVLYHDLKSLIETTKKKSGAERIHFAEIGDELIATVKFAYSNIDIKLNKYAFEDIIIPKPFENTTFILQSEDYKRAVNRVSYAVNPKNFYSNIKGINVMFTGDEIYFAGTNGVEVAELVTNNTSNLFGETLRLNYDFFKGLYNLIQDDQQLEFEVHEDEIRVHFEGMVFGGKLICGSEFPDYRSQFNRFDSTVVLKKEVLLEGIRPMLCLLNPEDNNKVTLSINGGGLVIQCERAKFVYPFEVDCRKNIEIGLNGRCFFDTIDCIDDEKILLKYSEALEPMVFDSASSENQKSVLMPLSKD